VRVVCANTRSLALAEAGKSGLELTIRHTANWKDYVERAQDALRRTRAEFEDYKELATELTKRAATQEQVETFLKAFLPVPDLTDCSFSKRVENNVLAARGEVRAILAGPTTPEVHRRTGYGIWQAGLEYLQHRRPTRKAHSKLNRSILSEEKTATNLHKLVLSVLG
jgi:hypothetical protein